MFDQERLSEKEFDITVKLVNEDLTLSRLADYMRSGTSLDMPQDVIQSTDIALRHAPIEQLYVIKGGGHSKSFQPSILFLPNAFLFCTCFFEFVFISGKEMTSFNFRTT